MSAPNPILTETIDRLCRCEALTVDETSAVLHEVMEGRASEVQTAALLIAFRAKGETVGELAGMAKAMRDLAVPVSTGRAGLVDTAGTGGGRPTFNVSTTAAFVAAGAGVPMAKHGNRSATGRSGSADVLEALGARIDLPPADVAACIEEIGFGFMFAPGHHPAMKHVVPVRKGLAVRTIFNFLGPLTNPAGATRQLIGVSDRRFLDIMAGALGELGCEHALLVASDDGMDELSTSGPTHIVELRADGHLDSWTLTPERRPGHRAPVGAGRRDARAQRRDRPRGAGRGGRPGARSHHAERRGRYIRRGLDRHDRTGNAQGRGGHRLRARRKGC